MMDLKKLIDKAEKILYDKYFLLHNNRYIHSKNVAVKMKEMASVFDLNLDYAYLIGLLHDITKYDKYEDSIKLIKDEKLKEYALKYKTYIHSFSAAYYFKEHFIDDDILFEAIAYHINGIKNMNKYTFLLTITDYISIEREYESCKEVRSIFEQKKYYLAFYKMTYDTIIILSKEKKEIDMTFLKDVIKYIEGYINE